MATDPTPPAPTTPATAVQPWTDMANTAAGMPMADPKMRRMSGIRVTIRMMNGVDLTRFTTVSTTW